MRKLIIDNVAFSIQKIGGISVVWYEIIKRLLEDNRFDSHYIEYDNANLNVYRKELDIKEKQVSLFKLHKYFRYINPKLGIKDSYIFHSSYYRVSRDKKAINFTTVHDFVYERSSKKNLATLVHIWQQKQAVMKSDYVVCISQNTKRDLFHYYKGVDPNKVHVIYNGVSDDYYKIDDIEDLKLPFPSKTYCIYVGVRRAYKNYRLTVESLAKTKYNLAIVGSPLDDEEMDFLDSTLGKGRYCCESRIPNRRLNELYNGAFALLYLSTYEGFGIPCLEAQKAGCPVVALNTSSIPEVVCDSQLLIDNPTSDNVVARILNLEDDDYRYYMVNKGIEFTKQFSWDRTYKELTNLYAQAFNECKRK